MMGTDTKGVRTAPAAGRLPGLRQVLLFCGAAALGGCSTFKQDGPGIFQSEAPENTQSVVTGVPAAWAIPATADPVADSWLDDFGDAQLKSLVEEAWANNSTLLAAISRRDAAAARSAVDKAANLPRLDFQAQVGRQRQINDFLGSSTLVPEDAYISRIRFGLGLSWELDVWNRALNLTQASVNDVVSAMLDVEAAKFSLAGQTATLWFTLVAADQKLAITKQLADSLDETVRYSTERQSSGLMTTAELLKARTDLAGADADIIGRQLERDRAARALEVILGRYPANQLQVAQRLPAMPPPITASVPSKLLERRPDIQAAALRVISNDKRLLAAKKNLLPRFTINASGGTQAKYRDLLFDDDSFTWSLGGGLLQPLFDGGQIRAGIRAQRALLLESISKYREKAYGAFREVEDGLATETALRAQLVHVQKAVDLSQQNETLATKSYNNGTLDAGTSMSARRGVLTAQLREIDLNAALFTNRVALDLALGGSPIVHDDPAPDRDVPGGNPQTMADVVPVALELASPRLAPASQLSNQPVPIPAAPPATPVPVPVAADPPAPNP